MTGPREACGVVALYAPRQEPARLAFFALYALQHRGQESAGICTADGISLHNLTGWAWSARSSASETSPAWAAPGDRPHALFDDRLEPRRKRPADGRQLALGSLALGHNGNLVNIDELRQEVERRGASPRTSTDSELVAQLIARAPGDDWLSRMRHALPRLQRRLLLGDADARPHVRRARPVGHSPAGAGPARSGGWVVASETCALDTIGAQLIREIEPGEILAIDADGVHSEQFAPADQPRGLLVRVHLFRAPGQPGRRTARLFDARAHGRPAGAEHPVDADFVMPVPDSATPAAIGFARAAGLPYREGLIKNRYIGRTFIQPDQRLREVGVELKFNPLPEVLRGKRIALVDDSIVRGTTTPRIVAMLRRAGAAEMHLRICAPPIRYACHLGVDTAPEESLIANTHSVEEIRRVVGADSLGFLSLDGLVQAIGVPEQKLCNACFHGRYPMPIDGLIDKLGLERSRT